MDTWREEEYSWFGIPTLSIKEFPSTFQRLRNLYSGFLPRFEWNRDSLEELLGRILTETTWDDLVAALDTRAEAVRNELVQRMFYRSCVAFYRFFDLFLAYLIVDGSAFKTWGEVTGYYSRFYFIHSWLNLLQGTWVDMNEVFPKYPHLHKPPKRFRKFFIFDTGEAIRILNTDQLKRVCDPPESNFAGSHQIWWALFRSVGEPDSFSFIDQLGFILTPFTFNPKERNLANYSYKYLEGFVELEWFDNTPQQMMAHFMPRRRSDRDFTSIEAYFEGEDPEFVDVGDFYTDEVQILWHSALAYLQLLRALNINQDFITAEKLNQLIRIHMRDKYPVISEAISEAIGQVLTGEISHT